MGVRVPPRPPDRVHWDIIRLMIWTFERARRVIYEGLFTLAVFIFLIHYLISGQAVYGDGIGYFSHLHSWVIDRDWNYTNEYRHIYDSEHNNAIEDSLSTSVQIVSTTSEGKAENFYGTGVAVLLLPFYLLAHAITLLMNLFGIGLSTSGYGDLYQILTGIGALIYTFLGLFFLEKVVNLTVRNRKISLISSLSIFLSTSLLYYGSFDVINSHFASFFLSSVFFYLLLGEPKIRSNLLLGLVAGLMTIVRLQDVVVVLIWLWINYATESVNVFLKGFLFGIIPMMIHWSTVFGNPLLHPYVRGIWERIGSEPTINLFGSLFDPITGLFFRTPLLLVLFGYFLYLIFKKKARLLIFLFVFFLFQFLIITFQGGWAAAAYGGRMYMSSLIFFGPLLGMLLVKIYSTSRATVYWFVVFFILLNFFSVTRFVLRDKGIAGGGHGTEVETRERMERMYLRWVK